MPAHAADTVALTPARKRVSWLVTGWAVAAAAVLLMPKYGDLRGAFFANLDTISLNRFNEPIGGLFAVYAFWFWYVAMCAGLGWKMLTACGFVFTSFIETGVLSLAAGWGVTGLGLYVLGLCHLWNRPVLYAFFALLSLPAFYWLWRMLKSAPKPERGYSFLEGVALWTLPFIALIQISGAFMPNIFFDSHVYHFALPELYFMRHAIVATPNNIYAGLPQLAEMIYSPALFFGLETGVHLLTLTAWLGAALLLIPFCEKAFKSKTAGYIAAVLFYSTPSLSVMCWNGTAEPFWTFYQLAAVYALSVRFSSPRKNVRWSVLAGVFTGLAMGTRYQALPLLPLLAVLIWFLAGKTAAQGEVSPENAGENSASPLREALYFAAAAVVVAVIWPLKNIILYGNPIYPFFQEMFSSALPYPDWRGLLNDANARHLGTLKTFQGVLAFLAHPWTELSNSGNYLETMGIMAMFSLPFALFARFKSPAARLVRYTLLALWVVWCFSTSMVRFFYPEMPLVCALSVAFIADRCSRKVYVFSSVVLLFLAFTNIAWALNWHRIFTTEEHMSREDFISYQRTVYPYPSYIAYKYINENLPHSRVAIVGETRPYLLKTDYLIASVLCEHPLMALLRRSDTAAQFAELLRREKVTHVFMNYMGYQALKGYNMWPMSEKQRAVLDEFSKDYLKSVFKADYMEVFEIKYRQ